jgi:endonuclease/exonuclease/phosphatase family metal-dependent hydrolase
VEDRPSLVAWCAAVGPAVIAAAAPEPTPHGSGVVAIVTWNTHVGGGDLPALVQAIADGSLTGGTPPADVVVLLQEVFRRSATLPLPAGSGVASAIVEDPPAGARQDIVDAARALGLALYYVPSMRNGRERVAGAFEDRGNAILSTLPLADFTAIELPYERQRRVALAATVTIGGAKLRVVSAHLSAAASWKRLRAFSSGVRAREARALAAFFADDVPTVLGVDLNTWSEGPLEPAYRTLQASFPATPRARFTSTFRWGTRLDYLFFRLPAGWQTDSHRLPSRFGSDHYPLMAAIGATPRR